MVDIQKLKLAKKQKGLSYDDLAQLTGLSRSTITNIFCGYIDLPRYETIELIERALGLAPTWTAEEQALGVGNHATVLSQRDLNTLTTIRRAEDVLGTAYVDKYLEVLELAVQQKLKK